MVVHVRDYKLLNKSPRYTYPHISAVFQRHLHTIDQDEADVCDVLVDKEEDETDPSQRRSLGKTADVASTKGNKHLKERSLQLVECARACVCMCVCGVCVCVRACVCVYVFT